MKGLDHLIYFSSTSDSSGTATVTMTFAQGTNPDTAQVQVQNKLQAGDRAAADPGAAAGAGGHQVGAQLRPDRRAASRSTARTTRTTSATTSPRRSRSRSRRITGVGDTQFFGSQYAMRIWLDPIKMANLQVTVGDVIAAVTAAERPGLGRPDRRPADGPGPAAQRHRQCAVAPADTPQQFREIIVRANPDGSTVKLGDVARVEIGAENEAYISRYNGHPATGLAIKLAPGANALADHQGGEGAAWRSCRRTSRPTSR